MSFFERKSSFAIKLNKPNISLLVILFGLRNSVKNSNKELSHIKKEITKEKNFIKILKTDFTNLSKSNRINKIAGEKLGLQKTNSYQIKQISDFYIN